MKSPAEVCSRWRREIDAVEAGVVLHAEDDVE